MNTVLYLLSLKDKHNYFGLVDDFDALIRFFDPKAFNDTSFPYPKEEFGERLKKDLDKASLEEITMIADSILKYSKDLNDTYLLIILREGVRNFIIRNPNLLNVRKYYKIIIRCIIKDLQKDLKVPIKLSYFKENGFLSKTNADVDSNVYKHDLRFNENLDKLSSNTTLIFNIYQFLYHEHYHMLVDELIYNPLCFKIDILKYGIIRTLRDALFERNSDDIFYNFFYEYLNEENNAEIYGVKQAKKKITDIDPNFRLSIITNFSNLKIKSRSEENSLGFAYTLEIKDLVGQEDYFEKLLDKELLKYPERISGILFKMYNRDGTRKDYNTLIKDFKEALGNSDILNKDDVKEMYYYLIYRLFKRMNNQERNELIRNEDINIIYESLSYNQKRLEKLLLDISSNKLYYITTLPNKVLNKKLILKELQQIKDMLKLVDMIRLEGELNVRKTI